MCSTCLMWGSQVTAKTSPVFISASPNVFQHTLHSLRNVLSGRWVGGMREGVWAHAQRELFGAGGQAPPLGKLAPCRESGNIYSQRYHHQQSQTVPALWEKGLQPRPWEMGHSQVLSRETRQFVLCLSRFVCSIGTPKAGLKQGPLKESTGAWQVARPLQKCSLAREQN